MTFVEILEQLRIETGVAGSPITSVVGLAGERGRLKSWVVQSWKEIQQRRRDWQFMNRPAIFNTIAGKQEYTPTECGITDFGWWINDSFRQYLTSAGVGNELLMKQWHSYEDFRDYYLLNTRRLVTNRPMDICISPSRSLLLGFTPNDDYTVTGRYMAAPQTLTLDADTPTMPERFHWLIIYMAQQKYGLFESAQEQISAGQAGAAPLLSELIFDQTPEVFWGAPAI